MSKVFVVSYNNVDNDVSTLGVYSTQVLAVAAATKRANVWIKDYDIEDGYPRLEIKKGKKRTQVRIMIDAVELLEWYDIETFEVK